MKIRCKYWALYTKT